MAGLSHFDDIAVRVPRVASHFLTMIVERFSQEMCAVCLPFTVAGLDGCNSQVQETVHPVRILRGFKEDFRFVRRRTLSRVRDYQGLSRIMPGL